MNKFAVRLKEALELRGMLPNELSKKSGIAHSSISEYLAGKVVARQDKVLLLSRALNVDPAWLMGANVSLEKKDRAEVLSHENPFNPVIVFIEDMVRESNIEDMDDISPEIMVRINQLSMECALKSISLAVSKNNKK